MKILYRELDTLAKEVASKGVTLVVLSDHGMYAVGRYGDHSTHGFWSTNFKDLGVPKITSFGAVINSVSA